MYVCLFVASLLYDVEYGGLVCSWNAYALYVNICSQVFLGKSYTVSIV